MKKRGINYSKGQLQISFQMIFAIILIVIFIVFAFFGIRKFMGVNNEILSNKFIDNLNDDIKEMSKSSRGSQEVSYNLPGKINKVCFHEDENENIYYFPDEYSGGILENVNFEATLNEEEELCFQVENKKVSFVIDKNYGEKLVTISKEGRDLKIESPNGNGEGSEGSSETVAGKDISNKNIYFKQDFQHRSSGLYNNLLIKEDFKNLHRGELDWGSKDNRIFIESESENMFLKNYLDKGKKISQGSGLDWFVDIPDKTQEELYFNYRMKFSDNMAKEYTASSYGPSYPYPNHWIAGKSSIAGITHKSWTDAGKKPGPDGGFHVYATFDSGYPRNSNSPDKLKQDFYIYHQNMRCNENCGGNPSEYVYWGEKYSIDYLFSPNTWYDITIRIVLNDPYSNNGIVEYFVNGKLINSYNNFRFRDTRDIRIEQFDFASFLGGGGSFPDENGWWAYDDIIIFNYKPEISGVPYGTETSNAGRMLI